MTLDSYLVKHYPNDTCGIWDIWEPCDVGPGDLGFMTGTDPLRPKFTKIMNVQDRMGFPVTSPRIDRELLAAKINYVPKGGLWSADATTDPNLVR